MSDFEKLLGQLTAMADEHTNLAKSMPQGGEDNAAAASEGDDAGQGGDSATTVAKSQGDDAGAGEGAPAAAASGDEGAPLTKSVTVDGEEHEVIEVDELVKSIHDLGTRFDSRDEVLVKSVQGLMGIAGQQKEMIQAQGQMIKSLQDQITNFGRQGAGRKTVLTVAEKPSVMAKATGEGGDEPEGLTHQEFLAKSQAAFDDHAISGLEYSTIDVCLRQGQQVNQELVSKVLAASNK